MFSDINAESTRRLTEAKSLVLLIKNEDLMRSLNLDSKVHKGAFFVLLYGALEYTTSVFRSVEQPKTTRNTQA